MHARPICDVIQTAIDLRSNHENLNIQLQDPATDENFDSESILTLLTIGSPFRMGGKVRVIVTGEYPIETLQECANEVGGIFSFKDTSRTAWEVL